MDIVEDVVRNTLVRRLSRSSEITAEDGSALADLPWRIVDYAPRTAVVEQGRMATRSCLLVAGFTIRHQALRDGNRHIQAYNVPGDIPDLHSLFLKRMDHTFGTISACTLAEVPHAALEQLCFERPRVGAALWRETLIDAACFRASISRISQLNASRRLAHLLCEVHLRLSVVGLAVDGQFAFPFTQEEMGELLGLSTVQVNRSLQELRSAGLLTATRHDIHLIDVEKLRHQAEFDPMYLHLDF